MMTKLKGRKKRKKEIKKGIVLIVLSWNRMQINANVY